MKFIPKNPWKDEKIHRILAFCEHGMTKELISRFFNAFKRNNCEILLDPFVGSGTVVVEAKKRCIDCIGIDSNPLCLLITKAKVMKPSISIEDFLEAYHTINNSEPLIPSERLSRYHTKRQLLALGKIRALIKEFNDEPLLLAVFVNTAEKFSKIRRSPAPVLKKQRKSNKDTIQIYEEFKTSLIEAYNDLNDYNTEKESDVHLILADSSFWLPKYFDGILTSPPFANNIDYIRHTQLGLLWAGMAKDSKDLGRLRNFQIPACEAAVRRWKKKTEKEWILEYISKIKSKRKFDTVLAQYFYYMEKHIELVAERLCWEAWYTIGDSIFSGACIPTHEILKRLAEEKGLRAEFEQIGVRSKNRRLYLLRLKAR